MMMALAGCARLLPSAAPPSTRTETLPPHKYVINRGLAVLAAIPRWMKSLTGSRDQLMLGPGPPWDPDPRPPSEVRFSDRRRLSSAGAGVSDSGLVDGPQRLVPLSRPAAFPTAPVTSSGLSLSACVSHSSPCPLALSDISSASQLSEVSPSTPSVVDVVSRRSGIDSPRLSRPPLSGRE